MKAVKAKAILRLALQRGKRLLNRIARHSNTAIEKRPILAYRAWCLSKKNDSPLRLQSISVDAVWQPGTPMAGDPSDERHGVFAHKTMRHLVERQPLEDAYGTVALAGQIVEHEDGYRAEFAYPMIVVLPTEAQAEEIRREYRCETLARNANHPLANMARNATSFNRAYDVAIDEFHEDSFARQHILRRMGCHSWLHDGWPAVAYALREIFDGRLLVSEASLATPWPRFAVRIDNVVIDKYRCHEACGWLEARVDEGISEVAIGEAVPFIGDPSLQDTLQKTLAGHLETAIAIRSAEASV